MPFLHTQLDFCGVKCHRPNVSVSVVLEQGRTNAIRSSGAPMDYEHLRTATTSSTTARSGSFHCDRESYSVISKRRLCGKFPVSHFNTSPKLELVVH